jgi:cysteine desulfurase
MSALFRQFIKNIGIELRRPIYFDANATTRMDPDVCRFMASMQKKEFGNPSSLHMFGSKARELVELARRRAAEAINADASEIVFTSGGTEANNTVIRSVVRARTQGHVITSSIEHPSVLAVFQELESEGFEVTYLGVDADGCVRIDELERAIRPETLLISVMHVNNELGTVQPIEAIGACARAHGVPFHSDAVQSFGKLALDVRALGIDYLTFSSHKINGPKGAGAIYHRTGSRLNPLLIGGHQERLLRAGTEATVAIAGFGRACTHWTREARDRHMKQAGAIKRIIIEGIREIFPDARINGSIERALPTTVNVTLPGIPNSEVLAFLDFHKIAVSVGSACVAGSDELSHVLVALGRSADEIRSSFRISFGRFNTEREARSFVRVMRRFAIERAEFFSYIMPGDLLLKDCTLGEMLVADIRTDAQRQAHPPIPSALRFAPAMPELKTLPRDRQVVLVCEDGYLSNLYSARLRASGWTNVRSLLGGYKRWRQYHRDDYYYHIMKDVVR